MGRARNPLPHRPSPGKRLSVESGDCRMVVFVGNCDHPDKPTGGAMKQMPRHQTACGPACLMDRVTQQSAKDCFLPIKETLLVPPSLQSVSKITGTLAATDNASFDVATSRGPGCNGPKGAGKPGVFILITGDIRPDSAR